MNAARYRAIGESGLLIGFGDVADDATFARVLALDQALAAAPPRGMIETVPAYTSVLIVFDPGATDHRAIERHVRTLPPAAAAAGQDAATHVVPVRHDAASAPDLPAVAAHTGLSVEAVIAAHLKGGYRVVMYGFAPGYAYLHGVPPALHLPRKPSAVRGVAVGSVMIAGSQCLITTLPMPTGWWVIGRTDFAVLQDDPDRPFRLAVGDRLRFARADP